MNTQETAQAIKSILIRNATKYQKDVTFKKPCVPFWEYDGGVGRCAHPTQGWTQGSSLKGAEFLLHMLKTVKSNAKHKGLDVDSLVIEHHLGEESTPNAPLNVQSS